MKPIQRGEAGAGPPTAKVCNVRVVVRFRPHTELIRAARAESVNTEFTAADDSTLFDIKEGRSVSVAGLANEQLNYDLVFQPSATQKEVFNEVSKTMVDDVLRGYNGTVMCYGQTGSGKTHTLVGDLTHPKHPERGIIPRAARYLFQQLRKRTNSGVRETTVRAGMVEIYKEGIQDLLDPRAKPKIREMANKTIWVQGLYEEQVQSFRDIWELMGIGNQNRAVAETKLNARSSRSHCVLILTIKQVLADGTVQISKLNFADLAGSERLKRSQAEGATLEETKKINQSLSALANCIKALTTQTRSHIPFRDSKLTYLLKDSLGGNTKTSLIVTCSSDETDIDESLCSLRFASRAKRVRNTVHINKVKGLGKQVGELRHLLLWYQGAVTNVTQMMDLVRNGDPLYTSDTVMGTYLDYLERARQAKHVSTGVNFMQPESLTTRDGKPLQDCFPQSPRSFVTRASTLPEELNKVFSSAGAKRLLATPRTGDAKAARYDDLRKLPRLAIALGDVRSASTTTASSRDVQQLQLENKQLRQSLNTMKGVISHVMNDDQKGSMVHNYLMLYNSNQTKRMFTRDQSRSILSQVMAQSQRKHGGASAPRERRKEKPTDFSSGVTMPGRHKPIKLPTPPNKRKRQSLFSRWTGMGRTQTNNSNLSKTLPVRPGTAAPRLQLPTAPMAMPTRNGIAWPSSK